MGFTYTLDDWKQTLRQQLHGWPERMQRASVASPLAFVTAVMLSTAVYRIFSGEANDEVRKVIEEPPCQPIIKLLPARYWHSEINAARGLETALEDDPSLQRRLQAALIELEWRLSLPALLDAEDLRAYEAASQDRQPEVSRGFETLPAPQRPPSPSIPPGREVYPSHGLESLPSEPTLVKSIEVPPAPRYLRSDLLHGETYQRMEAALQVGENYLLVCDIDLQPGAAGVTLDEERLFATDAAIETTELALVLRSPDFDLLTPNPQILRLPRRGRSSNKARFEIRPQRPGLCELHAALFKDNNFIQDVFLQVNVANAAATAIASATASGRAPAEAFPLQPRDLSILIREAGDAFELTLVGPVAAQASLKLTLLELERSIADLRAELLHIVYLYQDASGGIQTWPPEAPLPFGIELPYQSGIAIPPALHQEALRRLARAGYRLFNKLFFARGDPGAVSLGKSLQTLAQQPEPLKIQVVSEKFMLPWGALYLDNHFDQPDPQRFLGFRHIIEHIPLQAQMVVLDSRIPSDRPRLQVGIGLNEDIDSSFGLDLVARQRRFWQDLQAAGQVDLGLHLAAPQLLQALEDPELPDQIVYFYGHALSRGLNEQGGPQESYLGLSGGSRLTLDDLELSRLSTQTFKGQPLVFINGCESAELSPLFYAGFMPFFTTRGARGLLGAECEVPALFAAEWARRFFNRFLPGRQPLGRLFLELRREFLDEHNNLLGLLYALYCDGDTQITPGLQLPPAA
jgi:hypothetical protein